MVILLTGFGPFDVFSDNPSEVLIRHLKDTASGIEIATLPVVYGKGREVLIEALDRHRPEACVSFGLNATIGHIALEEIALNIRASEVPDNDGNIHSGEEISHGGPLAIRSGLPLDRIQDRLRTAGIPANRSYSAGVYLCNEVFYTLIEWCSENGAVGGFIHIPMAAEMISDKPRMYRNPTMSLDMIKKAGEIVLDSIR
ncbi:MAG: pyroglutamyl-peptidase I [Thermoplasmatota archaeon]